MGYTDEKIQECLNTIPSDLKSKSFQPEIEYDATVDFNKFFLAALKIAYEYGYYKLGETFYADETAQRICKILYKATKGNFDEKYDKVILLPPDFSELLKPAQNVCCHMLVLHKDIENRLLVHVILFLSPAFSFSVCISDDASKYKIDQDCITEIVLINS